MSGAVDGAVTMRADPVLVRADLVSTVDRPRKARMSSNGTRASFELPVCKGLPLTYCVSGQHPIFPP
jgi:hypothetical protein